MLEVNSLTSNFLFVHEGDRELKEIKMSSDKVNHKDIIDHSDV